MQTYSFNSDNSPCCTCYIITLLQRLRHRKVTCAGICPPDPPSTFLPALCAPRGRSTVSSSSSGFQLDSANGDTGRRRGRSEHSLGFLPAGHCFLFRPQLPPSALPPQLQLSPVPITCSLPAPRGGTIDSVEVPRAAPSFVDSLPRPVHASVNSPFGKLCSVKPHEEQSVSYKTLLNIW